MGIVHAHRGRPVLALIMTAFLVLAAVAALGVAAGPAGAQTSFATCASCHTDGTTHAAGNANHSGIACATCHTGGFDAPNEGVTSAACASCHKDVAGTLAKPTHAANACGTTPGCHGCPAAVAATTMTLRAAPAIVKVGKSVVVSGSAGPLPALAGARVALKVERKVGTKWVKLKAVSKSVNATSGAFSWSYKTAKKGSHRVTASIAKTSTYTMKKLVKSFKVK